MVEKDVWEDLPYDSQEPFDAMPQFPACEWNGLDGAELSALLRLAGEHPAVAVCGDDSHMVGLVVMSAASYLELMRRAGSG